MSKGERKSRQKKRLGSFPFVSVVLSITLALFVIGVFGLLFIYTNELSKIIRENVEVQIFLNKHLSENDKIAINKTLASKPYILVKEEEPQINMITKEEAAAQFIEETGEDFSEFLGENPLRDVMVVKIHPDYHSVEEMRTVKTDIEGIVGVFEVTFLSDLIGNINRNLRNMGFILVGLAVILFLTAMVLINNTIKLALFSQRFLIRSMQLVGATAAFITKPFLIRSFYYGLIAGLMATGLLVGGLEYAGSRIEDLAELQDTNQLIALMVVLLLLGILVSLGSTYRAVNKYLKMSLDELY